MRQSRCGGRCGLCRFHRQRRTYRTLRPCRGCRPHRSHRTHRHGRGRRYPAQGRVPGAQGVVGPSGPSGPAYSVLSGANNWYVATTGNDTTGNGTSGSPWLTLTKALAVANTYTLAPGANLTIWLADGNYSSSGADFINHPQGAQITITGTNAYTASLTAASGFAWASNVLTGTITVGTVSGGGTIAVGDFLLVTTMPAASGGWGCYLTGLMKVTSVAGTSIGVTMPAYVNGIPSGTVTGGTLTVLKTRLTLTGTYTSAFQLTTNNPGTSSLGLLQNMALVGPDITTTNAINGGKIFCSQIGVWQFQTGFAAQVGADIVAVNCAATSAVGFHASQGQIAVNNCVANGCMSGGFLAENSGSIFGYAGVQTATGCGYGIYAGNGGQFMRPGPQRLRQQRLAFTPRRWAPSTPPAQCAAPTPTASLPATRGRFTPPPAR